MVKMKKNYFLGEKLQSISDYSEKTAQDIDDEIKVIVTKGMDRAEKVLEENIDELHKFLKNYLKEKYLMLKKFSKILKGEELPPAKRNGNGEQHEEVVPDHVKKMIKDKKEPI